MKHLHWTAHAKMKMRQYGISESRVKRVLRSPARVEAGIAPKTIAVMQPTHTKRPQEVWVMYKDTPKACKVIAAWRYPGVSPVREPPPFPDDVSEAIYSGLGLDKKGKTCYH